jgi:hypothetical protein
LNARWLDGYIFGATSTPPTRSFAVPDTLFHKLYSQELERRAAIQGDTNVPLGVLALLGSGMIVLLREYRTGSAVLDAVFWSGFATGCAAYAVAIYLVVRSFHPYTYRHLSFPSELKRYHNGLRAHYTALGTPLLAEREFEEYVERLLIEATDRNAANNVNRAEYLRKTNRAMILVLVAAGLSSVPYAIRERTKEQVVGRVETSHRETGPVNTHPSASHRPAAPTVPPKPAPPSNFDERTGVKAPSDRQATPPRR